MKPKKTVILFCIGIFCILATWQVFADTSLRSAQSLLQEGEFIQARKVLESIIENNHQESPLAWYFLGYLSYRAGEYEEAAYAFSQVSNVAILPYARFYQAESLFWSHDAYEARRIFSAIAQENTSPFLHWALLRIADSDFALGDYHSAAKRYQTFLRSYPGYPYKEALFFAFAECMAKTGNPTKAAEAYLSIWIQYPHTIYAARADKARAELLEQDVSFANPTFRERLERARNLRIQRQHDRALRELMPLRSAILSKSFSGDAALLISLDIERGRIFLRQGKAQEALDILQVHKSSLGFAKQYLAEAQALSGDPEAGALSYASYLNIKKSARGSQIRPYAKWLFHYGLYKKARKEYAKLSTRDSQVRFRLAWCDYRLGRFAEAAKGITSLSSRFSEYRDFAKYWQARIKEKQGKQSEAVLAYQAMLQADDIGYYSILARSRLYDLGYKSSKMATMDSEVDPWRYIESRTPKDKEVKDAFLALIKVSDSPKILRAYEFYQLGLYENGREELADIYAQFRYGNGAKFQSRSPYFPGNWKQASLSTFSSTAMVRTLSSIGEEWDGVFKKKRRRKRKRARKRSRGATRAIPSNVGKQLGIAFGGLRDAHYPMYLAPVSGKKRYYPQAYAKDVVSIAEQLSHQPEEIWSIMHTESLFHRFVASRVGAIGLLQIMPKTGRAIALLLSYDDFRPGELFDVETNLFFGAWYYRQLKKVFQGQLPLAIASYNGGPYMIGRIVKGKAWTNPEIDEIVEEIPAAESRGYAKKVLSKIARYQKLYQGSTDFSIDLELNTKLGDAVDF